MHVSALKQSNYLTRADVGSGILVTIKNLYQDNIAKQGQPEENKWLLEFEECDKPLILNPTNGQAIAAILKNEETDSWVGHKIVLYDDPNVSFGGRLVGGIRIRAPRGQAAKTAPKTAGVPTPRPRPAPAPVDPGPEPELTDEEPF
jgi:hypothetical protein